MRVPLVQAVAQIGDRIFDTFVEAAERSIVRGRRGIVDDFGDEFSRVFGFAVDLRIERLEGFQMFGVASRRPAGPAFWR